MSCSSGVPLQRTRDVLHASTYFAANYPQPNTPSTNYYGAVDVYSLTVLTADAVSHPHMKGTPNFDFSTGDTVH